MILECIHKEGCSNLGGPCENCMKKKMFQVVTAMYTAGVEFEEVSKWDTQWVCTKNCACAPILGWIRKQSRTEEEVRIWTDRKGYIFREVSEAPDTAWKGEKEKG